AGEPVAAIDPDALDPAMRVVGVEQGPLVGAWERGPGVEGPDHRRAPGAVRGAVVPLKERGPHGRRILPDQARTDRVILVAVLDVVAFVTGPAAIRRAWHHVDLFPRGPPHVSDVERA